MNNMFWVKLLSMRVKKESKVGKAVEGLFMGLGGFAAIFIYLSVTHDMRSLLGFGVAVVWALWWAYELGREVSSKKE